MSGLLICPNCSHQFEATEAFRDEVQRELNTKAAAWQAKKEEEYRSKETQFQLQLQLKEQESQQKIAAAIKAQEESIKQKTAADFENQLNLLKQANEENQEKLKEARKKEMEFLQKEQALKAREAEIELEIKRQLMRERELLKEQLTKEETEKNILKDQENELQKKELQKQLDDLKKQLDIAKQKADQKSMQLQGEVQELLLEELLQQTFPFDVIEEVGKGVRGADCVQIVRTSLGAEAGKIIYESKRTKDFSNEWIEKLKADMRSLGADVAVIVTQAFPKDMDRFGEKDGVYICSFAEVRSVALLLRNAVLRISEAKKSQENKGDKMVMLYDYLTGAEFSEQWKAIREGFLSMKMSIQRERDAMEKLWKSREKQLEKVLLNATHIHASVEGIAGADAVNLNLLEDNDPILLD